MLDNVPLTLRVKPIQALNFVDLRTLLEKMDCWEDKRITIRNGIQRVEVEVEAVERRIEDLTGILAAPDAPANNHPELHATRKDQATLKKILENTKTIKKTLTATKPDVNSMREEGEMWAMRRRPRNKGLSEREGILRQLWEETPDVKIELYIYLSRAQRMGREKEKELAKKRQPPSTPQAASTASLTSPWGTNMTLNVNLSGGVQQQDTPLRDPVKCLAVVENNFANPWNQK
ncbi:hypothetical protein GJ744_003402 [Endocarpon pusillum]|uniref:Uncharacterized protein n=1 Tax=Endocarpon pusillum TaxID=364733 RepID=A0A8H7A6X9_9EURO|nr:hypothetical protein GJ744_003402 [Endocarpon pusillum]